tara:strand:+ start:354 stop:731 length:378 start_codon:yes stop_codon:yes gene_type:complete
MATYRGYNTVGNEFAWSRLEDQELIKRDLLNHFHIRKGEKLMNPEFGSDVWNYVFDPLTPDTKQAITDDVTRVVNHDPRTQVNRINIVELDYGIQIEIDMTFIRSNQNANLILQFNRDSNNITII